MPNPVNPNDSSQGSGPVQPKVPGPPGRHARGSIQGKPMKFLGMQFDADQSSKLWNVITQMVNAQIQKDQADSIKAIKNFGKVPGDPDYED